MEVRVLSSALQLVAPWPLVFGAPNRQDAADTRIEARSRIPRSSVLSAIRDPSTILFVPKIILGTLTRAWSDPRLRRALSFGSVVAAITVLGLTVLHFSKSGFPLDGAEPRLAGVAGAFFVLAYTLKAYGWQQLFRPGDRPTRLALAAAGGAASVSGAALPGRFDDVVRIAVVRRSRTTPAGVSTLCLSLFMLGLIDTAALLPFSTAAAIGGSFSPAARAVLGVVAFAGVGATVLVAFMPRLGNSSRLARFRIVRWLVDRTTPLREAGHAWLYVAASWAMRATGLCLLLSALGISNSVPLAIAFLTAASASAALPIAPAGGAVTQAGAGAAILIATGVPFAPAAGFAVAAQGLFILAGAAVLAFAGFVHGANRLSLRVAPAAA